MICGEMVYTTHVDMCYELNYVFPQKCCLSSNPQYLRLWSYLVTEMLQILLT